MKGIIWCSIVLLCSQFMTSQEKDTLIDFSDFNISEIKIFDTRLKLASSLKDRNIQILDKEQIKQLPVGSINELLSYVSGVDLRQRGPFGSQADLSIDGGGFEQNLVLLNGQKISDSQTGHNSLMIPVPLEAIERIEVVRGPSARLFGVNSLTGVVNIVTMNPENDGVFAKLYSGTNFKKDLDGTGEVFHGRGFELGGTMVKRTHNHMIFGVHESGNGHRYNTAFNTNKMFYQGNVSLNPENSMMILTGWSRNSFGANGFYASPGDKESKEIVSTYLLALRSEHQLSNKLVITPGLMYRYNHDDYRYYRNRLDVGRSQHYSHALTSSLKVTYELQKASVSVGAEMRYEDITSNSIGDHSRSNYGFYAEYKSFLFEYLNYNIGTYVNYNTSFGWQMFPGIDMSYDLSSQWKMVFSAGSSQRVPSFTDLYLDQRPGNYGNPLLEPEESYQVELGTKFNKEKLQVNGYVFYRGISEFIDWVRASDQEPWRPYNANQNKTLGINSSLKYTFKRNRNTWVLSSSYTFLSPKIQVENDKLYSKYALESLRNQWVGTLNLKRERCSFLVAMRYNERLNYKSYWVYDLRMNYDIKKVRMFLDVQNVFNTTYLEAGAVPMPGRWLTLGVQYNGLK